MIWILRGNHWPLAALAFSAAMILGAHAFEVIGQMSPCNLCLRQREVYWAAAALALAGVAFAGRMDKRAISGVDMLLGMAFMTGAIVAGYHAGVEYHVFPELPSCAPAELGGLEGLDVAAALSGAIKVQSCADPEWTFLGVSMAGYNFLISAVLAGVSFIAAARAQPKTWDEHEIPA